MATVITFQNQRAFKLSVNVKLKSFIHGNFFLASPDLLTVMMKLLG